MQTLPGLAPASGTSLAPPPAVLTIAGFDPSSGAGITADLKVFAAFGLFGLACPTTLTVQSTQGVRSSRPVDAGYVTAALDCLADDIRIRGIKIGALADAAIVQAVVAWLRRCRVQTPELPVVLDPILHASSGHALLQTSAVNLLVEELLPLCTVLTPNLAEAVALSGMSSGPEAAHTLAQTLWPGPDSGVVLTGGDTDDANTVTDLLVLRNGHSERLVGTRVRTQGTHGTGCAFSSALLCGLVPGLALVQAARDAKHYVEAALAAAYPLGKGKGPMHHLFASETADAARRVCGPSE